MPAFFIHGVPETHHLWTPVIDNLDIKEFVAVDLPGFSSPLPNEFSATKEGYVDWLIAEIERVGQPVDLVAHDWGCILAVRVASLRPDLVRTWAGGGGAVDSEYQWHPLAKIWQTPGKGEAYFADFDAAAMTDRLCRDGVPPDLAAAITSRVDRTMGESILSLYRSAVEVGREWQPGLSAISAPGLVFHGVRDQACPQASAEQLARDTDARRMILMDAGHWFPVQQPGEMADALSDHWTAAHKA